MSNVQIDHRRRQVICNNSAVPEATPIILDGTLGKVFFSAKGSLHNVYTLNRAAEKFISSFVEILSSLSNEEFKGLPLDLQMHMAKLKSSLRKIGLSK